MPETQHPTSDTQRLEALRQAKNRLDAVDPADVVLTPATVTQLNGLFPQWDQEIRERNVAEGAQSEATEAVQQAGSSLRMFISHFLQAFNNAVTRGEFAPSERAAFQLPPSQESLPVLTSEADLVTWGHRLKSGEATRIADGLTAVTMPPIASVEANLTAFESARAARDAAVDEKNKESDDVIALRDTVDAFIREDLWYEVQSAFRKDDPATTRRKSRLWGVQYRFRSGEEPDECEEATSSGEASDSPATPLWCVRSHLSGGNVVEFAVTPSGAPAHDGLKRSQTSAARTQIMIDHASGICLSPGTWRQC